MKLQRIMTSLGLTTCLALALAGCGLTQPKLSEVASPMPNVENSSLTATIELEKVDEASFSAQLNYRSSDTVALSGMALRLVFPKQDAGANIEPFIIPETTRAKFWQPLINQLDCTSDSINCYADLALLTLSPSGSDFSGLEQIVGLNPELFTATTLAKTALDTEISKVTTKEAAVITLDLNNTVTAK